MISKAQKSERTLFSPPYLARFCLPVVSISSSFLSFSSSSSFSSSRGHSRKWDSIVISVTPGLWSVAGAAFFLGMPPGDAALLITRTASASYIAVPAAMRLALPEAKPSIYLTLSLGVTFPFNVTIGIPIYIYLALLINGQG